MWVSDPDRLISEINPGAEDLLGLKAEECLAKRCFEVVAGVETSGRPFCQKDCPIRQNWTAGMDLEVYHLESPGGKGSLVPFHLLPIAIKGPDGRRPWLVHCVVKADRCKRLHNYVTRVANRVIVSPEFVPDNRPLTPREGEILDLMADDLDLDQIAHKLHVSYHTVRNHVQHILPKLSAHSIQQAIAIYLLEERAKYNRVPL